MEVDPGFNIVPSTLPLGFSYGPGCFGPKIELRSLDSIRQSLLDPNCMGPDPVYAIAMDVGRIEDRQQLVERNLLFGAVAYAAGRLGYEPVRSQGHVHKPSPRNGWSTPEVYEIWSGQAVVLMQEFDRDDPGRCFAVEAGRGDVVIVPPGWAHATISADSEQPLVFGAWCDRDYGFVYEGVRAHGGLAWFPILGPSGRIQWQQNPTFSSQDLCTKAPADYSYLGLQRGTPIYRQFIEQHNRFDFVPQPALAATFWKDFVP
ncbi:MAG: hypothetical protein IT425_06340 [Pirellulales bacterium]|nr:hypothetical protein [Pirellulales bacterium]